MTDQRAAAVLVAAGAGVRLGAGVPKALVDLDGRPLVVHALRALEAASSIGEIVVVANAGQVDVLTRTLTASAAGPVTVVAGGDERRDSVRRGLGALRGPETIVAVHDAARPLASTALIDRVVAALEPPWVAVAPGLPVVDTLKAVDPERERVLRTVDRRNVWAVQTPQVFDLRSLLAAHDRIDGSVTDDLELIEAAGGRARMVRGEARALKITFPEDLLLAAALLAHDGGSA